MYQKILFQFLSVKMTSLARRNCVGGGGGERSAAGTALGFVPETPWVELGRRILHVTAATMKHYERDSRVIVSAAELFCCCIFLYLRFFKKNNWMKIINKFAIAFAYN